MGVIVLSCPCRSLCVLSVWPCLVYDLGLCTSKNPLEIKDEKEKKNKKMSTASNSSTDPHLPSLVLWVSLGTNMFLVNWEGILEDESGFS